MPNALPTENGTRTFSGARAYFTFNEEVVGYASGCSGGEEIMYEPVDTLDHLEVREHVPVGYRVNFTAAIFRTINNTGAIDNKTAPGSLKQMNIFPKFDQILKLDGVKVTIVDSVTGKTVFFLTSVKTASYNFQISARGLVAQNVTFVAIKAQDESEVAIGQ